MNSVDELFAGWLAGTLTPAEAQQLKQALADPLQRQRWRALADLEGALAESGAASQNEPAEASPVTTTRRRIRPVLLVRRGSSRSWHFMVAAALAVAVAVAVAVSGVWWLSRPVNGDLPSQSGQLLMAGATVVGPTRLQWNDGSQIELHADGAARVLDSGKGLFLDHGFLEADIVTQKSGTLFLVRSAQSVTKVIGTHFSLNCEAEATTLRVREGRVVFIAQSGEEQLVTSGGSAVALSPGRATSTPFLSTSAKPTKLLVTSDLVGWWPLDEGSGTVAHDRSGHGHDGQIQGAQWTAHGLRFNGGDDRVDIAPNGALAGLQAGNYAVCAWFRPASLPATRDRNDSRASRDRISMIAGRTGWHIGLYLDDLGQFAMQHHLVGDVPSSAVSAPVAIPEQWFHLVGMVDRIHGETRLMVDGVQAARAAWTPGAVAGKYAADQPWHIGIGEPDSPEFRWSTKGLIREVRCYARTLSDLEISRLAEPTVQP